MEIERYEQKLENTWDLTKIYSSLEELENDKKYVLELLDEEVKYRGHIMDSSDNLYKVLYLDTEVARVLDKIGTYVYRKHDEDIANTSSLKLLGDYENLYVKASSETSFITPEILKSDISIIKEWIEENSNLKEYELYLDRLFRVKKHTLSEQEEYIISELGELLNKSEKIAGIIRNSEIEFGTFKDENENEVTLTNANYTVYSKSKDRRVRKDVFNLMYDSYSKFKNTFSETIQGEVNKNVKIAKLRKFDSALESSLFYNRTSKDVYRNLIDVVNSRLDVIYKYYDLKKEVSGIEDYNIYDTYLSLESDYDKDYSYEGAKEIILDVVKVFGDDYVSNIERAFNERWIDIYPNKNKRGGAYSSGSKDTNPYILLNYQNKYNDVSTLIHELGHSMHTLYSGQNNLYQYSGYKIFVAEVASTTNEMLLSYYMLNKTDDVNVKRVIIAEMLDNFKATLYRQTMFSEFEEFMHNEIEKGNILTNNVLCDKYLELVKKYFGDNVIIDEKIKYEWMRIPHFYYNFYVYQYATGISAACYIVNRILNKEENAVEDYLAFLKKGNSMDPIDELKVAGVDMTDKEVINKAIDMFDNLIDEYRNLTKVK